jgi:hypothetical protein
MSLVYLYAIAPPDVGDPPDDLAGVEDAPVRVIRAAGVAAAVSDAPEALYADDPLNTRLQDLAWVGERGIAHERVLDWFAERGPVIPLSLFSLHRDESRVRDRLESESQRLIPQLERLRGRREWGIRLWRGETAADHLEQISPAVADLTRIIDAASPGKRYLLNKKRDELRAEELRSASRRLAQRVFGSLGEVADRSASVPIPAAQREGSRVLLLNAAFLVADSGYADFQRRVGEVAREVGEIGFEVQFTGPWPPYHFVDSEDA